MITYLGTYAVVAGRMSVYRRGDRYYVRLLDGGRSMLRSAPVSVVERAMRGPRDNCYIGAMTWICADQ